MKPRWNKKPCGCVKTRLVSTGERVIIRCTKHRDKTFKNRVHLHFGDDGIERTRTAVSALTHDLYGSVSAQAKAGKTMGDHCLSGGQGHTRDPEPTASSADPCPRYSLPEVVRVTKNGVPVLGRIIENLPEMAWFWLSFADGSLPEGEQFLGVAVVAGKTFPEALTRSHLLGLNPGGEIQFVELPEGAVPPEEWRERLLGKDDLVELEVLMDIKW